MCDVEVTHTDQVTKATTKVKCGRIIKEANGSTNGQRSHIRDKHKDLTMKVDREQPRLGDVLRPDVEVREKLTVGFANRCLLTSGPRHRRSLWDS